MKNIFKILVLIFVFTSCKNKDKEKKLIEKPVNEIDNTEIQSTTWIDSFKEFRNAVYQDDKKKIKSFIDFPLINDNNEIWGLIYQNDTNNIQSQTLQNNVKTFTELDFDENYHKVFPKAFINSILKIKTEILFKTGAFETIFIKEDKTDYKIYSTFDKKGNKLELHLYSETLIKENGQDEEIDFKAEFSVIYYFDIINNKQLKFRYITMAG